METQKLQGFVPYKFKKTPLVSFAYYGTTFNIGVLDGLDRPEYVQILIDRAGKRLAIKPCNRNANHSVRASIEKNDNYWRINHQDFQNTISNMMGWNFSERTYRVLGLYVREENAYIFDLSNAECK